MCKVTAVYLSIVLFFIFTSCSNKQYQALFQQRTSFADTSSSKSGVTLSEYRIQPQDVLQIRNLQDTKYIANQSPITATGSGNASQGETFQVEEDGTVKLPALGSVKVSGLKRTEAQKLVEDLYGKNLLVNPIIELKIVNLKVTLLGEIKAQGNYPLIKDRTTLVELIGEAGGLTEKANEKDIKILRGTEAAPQVININLDDIRSINDPNTILQNGDIIYIAQSVRAVRADNLQNFSIFVQPALILFNTALIIFTLVRK